MLGFFAIQTIAACCPPSYHLCYDEYQSIPPLGSIPDDAFHSDWAERIAAGSSYLLAGK